MQLCIVVVRAGRIESIKFNCNNWRVCICVQYELTGANYNQVKPLTWGRVLFAETIPDGPSAGSPTSIPFGDFLSLKQKSYRNKRLKPNWGGRISGVIAFPLSKNRSEVSARNTPLDAAGQEDGIDAQPSEHANVARNAWKLPLHIYNLTSDIISILNIHYLHYPPKKVHKIYLVQEHPIIISCFGTKSADKAE